MRTLRKRLLWATSAPFGLIVLLLVWALVTYPSTYVWRFVFWQNADVFDYQRFPERHIENAGSPFQFAGGSDEDAALVRTLFETNPLIRDLDMFLDETGTQAFIVIQNDRILYEKYFNGYERDSIVTSFSVAKSFVSALIGIAIEEGRINSVDDPITKYLPELGEREAAFNEITIRHLLMMSSGIKYREFTFFTGDDVKTYYYPDLRQLALEETRVVGKPGEKFVYNNYHPLLLGLIIERATGASVAHYLQEKIWQPLGMEFPGSWSLDSDASGFEAMNGYYGYMWWGMHRADGHYDFSAVGNHGQFVYISPQNNLIIVRNGERYGIEYYKWLQVFYQFASGLAAHPTN